jgi:heme oxygenase
MLTRLTLETQVHHAGIDAALLGPLANPTLDRYRRFLCLSYGFELPIEAAVAMVPELSVGFVEPRIKSGRIASDLLALGIGVSEYVILARRYPRPALHNPAQALGWMYAAERTMLHHEAVRAQLEAWLPGELDGADAYLTTYAGAVDERWRELGAMLDHVAWDGETADEIVEAALVAFEVQYQWLTRNDQPSVLVTALRAS